MAVADFAVYVIFQKRKKTPKASQQRPFCSSKLQRVHDVKPSIMDFDHDNILLPPPSSPSLLQDCGETSKNLD